MAEENFKLLLLEQKKTNELLTAQGKPPTVAQSARNSLGEILNDIRLDNKDKIFQRKEGITKVDDKVDKSNKVLNTQSGFFTEQLKYFERQDNILERMFENSTLSQTDIFATKKAIMKLLEVTMGNRKELEHIESASSGMYKDFQGNYRLTASQKVELEKKEAANEKKNQTLLSKLNSQFKGIGDFLRSNKFAQSAGSFLGKALLITGLLGFLKFISSPKFIEFAAFLDKTIVPVLSDIFDVLKSVGAKAIELVAKLGGNILDPEQDMMTKFTSAVLLAALGVMAFFSKSILTFVGGLALKALIGAAGITLGALFSPIGLIITGFIAAIAGAVVGLIEGQKTFDQARAEGDNVALALTKATGTFVANLIGLLPDLLIKAIGSLVSVFDKDLGAKIKSFSFSGMIQEVLNDIGNLIKNAFKGVFSFFRKIFMGKDAGELTEEIGRLEGRLETEKRDAVRKSLENRIDALKLQRDEAIATGERVGGLGNMLGSGDVSDQSKFAGGAYKGGRVGQGQSILVGEMGPELMIPRTDAQIFSARRSEEMIMAALQRGLSGGGEGNAPFVVTADNSVRSNSSTTNVVNETITPLDTLTTSVVSSV